MLASCAAASAADLQSFGSRVGQRTAKLVRALALAPAPHRAHAELEGIDVHAEVALDGRDRARLKRLCRYLPRPPLALERLEEHGDGRLRLRFEKAWKHGTHAVLLEPFDLLARLAALVPPSRFRMLRYHRVLAGHASARSTPRTRRAARRRLIATATCADRASDLRFASLAGGFVRRTLPRPAKPAGTPTRP